LNGNRSDSLSCQGRGKGGEEEEGGGGEEDDYDDDHHHHNVTYILCWVRSLLCKISSLCQTISEKKKHNAPFKLYVKNLYWIDTKMKSSQLMVCALVANLNAVLQVVSQIKLADGETRPPYHAGRIRKYVWAMKQ
jgi:hypothetical protein